MNSPRLVRIFLSSPTDVHPEREAAERIVVRLNGVYSKHIKLSLERWERRFYEATKGFQESIAAMDTFDIVVGIVWKRIGSELPPEKFRRDDGTAFESGTVYEIESALAANRRSGKPSVYVFRSTRPVTFTEAGVEQERLQKQSLDAWWVHIFRDAGGHYLHATNEFSTIEDFEVKFEACLVDWLQQKQYIPSGPVWDIATLGSPYPGLVAYDSDRTPVFFGRQLAIDQAREELLAASKRDRGLPALFVIGASGSGKSSLVRAGLLPTLVEPGTIPGIDLWRSAMTEPTVDSLATLAERLYAPGVLPELTASAQPGAAKWARLAAESPEAAAEVLAWALDRVGEAECRRTGADHELKTALMLVVDQLESVFGTNSQKPFSRALLALITSGRVWLLATMRSDRYADLQLDPDLLALKRDGATYDLPPPGPAEIADIVKGPARAAGLAFGERDSGSLAGVLVEAAPNADALPLLQMTLSQLFERRDGETLSFAAYDAIGGVDGAIAAHANAVFAEIPAQVQRELAPLLRALVRDVSRRSDRTVRFTARSTERKLFETSAARENLVKTLVDRRLLVSDGANIRVAHEALLRRWDRARQTVEQMADAQLRLARLRTLMAAVAAVVFLLVGIVAFWEAQRARQQSLTLSQTERGLNLRERGWGVVFAENSQSATKGHLGRLLERRKEVAGSKYLELTYRPGESARQLLARYGADCCPLDPIPYYLLIVGNPEEIPYAVEYELASNRAVGRIFFEKPQQYAAYADNVVLAEGGPSFKQATVVLFGPTHLGDTATKLTARSLLEPIDKSFQGERQSWTRFDWSLKTVIGESATKSKLRSILSSGESPALLFIASHGMQTRKDSPKQRELQGAILCSEWPGFGKVEDGMFFSAADLTADLDLTGTIIFAFVSFSAGTPQYDEFFMDYNESRLDLSKRPKLADHDIMSMLPMQLLGITNRGALAFIGHVDRNFAFPIQSKDGGAAGASERNTPGLFSGLLRRLMNGYTVGLAMDEFRRRYTREATVLQKLQQTPGGDDRQISNAALEATDMRNYVIIGDPAVSSPARLVESR
jgi:hypothetical protein